MIRDTVPLVQNFYESTAIRKSYPALQGKITADVCVIGGGIAGCSTALHLARHGYRVILLEDERIGTGASGRSGGQLLPGYSCGQSALKKQLGNELAHQLWDMSVEAVQLAVTLIKHHNIQCDLKFGHIDAAIKPRHYVELLRHQQQLQGEYNYRSMRMLEADELRSFVHSPRYLAGLYDSAAASIHPLNYTLGLAQAANEHGAVIHEHSRVNSITHDGDRVIVKTNNGNVTAGYAVLCANVANSEFTKASPRILPVATYAIATGPLELIDMNVMNQNVAVSDCNFVLDYFRVNHSRLIFGGGISYSGQPVSVNTRHVHQRMLKVFPQLKNTRIDYAWHGLLDMTMNRAPDFGRIDHNVYYLQGFSGHGLALTTLAGKLVAESIAVQNENFDLFARIKHQPFPGGPLRTPLFVLAMLWYRLRDLI